MISSIVSFFFNDTATTEIYTLSLHDALPIFLDLLLHAIRLRGGQVDLVEDWNDFVAGVDGVVDVGEGLRLDPLDRKSTRLNSSHANISYAVFCLKKTTSSPSLTAQSLIRSTA